MDDAFTALRSLLFVPGNKENMLTKALGTTPDALVPDMEDSVPDDEKASARQTMRAFLPRLAAAGPLLIPRVNSLETPWIEEDLDAVVADGVFGISVGKIRRPADVVRISEMIAAHERRRGLPEGRIRLVPWIETAEAIVRCHEILTADRRVVAAAFGAEDFTNDMGIERTDDETELAHARATLAIAARAANVLALDTPYFKLRDPDGLAANALRVKRLGFKGKFAIHPEQIDALNAAFAPSAAEIEDAERIVAAYDAAERAGRGSTSLDGRVIDVPVVKRARAVLRLAERMARHG